MDILSNNDNLAVLKKNRETQYRTVAGILSPKYFILREIQHDNKPSRKCAYMLLEYDIEIIGAEDVIEILKTRGHLIEDFENGEITNDDDGMVIALGAKIPNLEGFFNGQY